MLSNDAFVRRLAAIWAYDRLWVGLQGFSDYVSLTNLKRTIENSLFLDFLVSRLTFCAQDIISGCSMSVCKKCAFGWEVLTLLVCPFIGMVFFTTFDATGLVGTIWLRVTLSLVVMTLQWSCTIFPSKRWSAVA